MRSLTEKPWGGESKIVVAFDIGTTQTAVTYVYLYPEGPQNVQRVSRWPGQEAQKGESKIPSLVWYDSFKKPASFGEEGRTPQVEEEAREHQWELAKYFKLHLHPAELRANHDLKVEPLPFGVTIERVYADFIGYLFRHTESFFKEFTLDGKTIWDNLSASIEFVFAHPNAWGLKEQTVLQNAAVRAGLVTNASVAEGRIHFVTEAEASVHFVWLNADLGHNLTPGTEFAVCDAGGSTIDTTVYTVLETQPHLKLEETKASACVQAGAIFVDRTAEAYFRNKFSKLGVSKTELNEYISTAVRSFERGPKRAFEDAWDSERIIKVGPNKLTNPAAGFKRGNFALTGEQLEKLFRPWVAKIQDSLSRQITGSQVKFLVLVGGFGDSPYLRKELRENAKMQVFLANDESGAKAVSDGALIWHLKRSVTARFTRFAYGTSTMRRGTPEEATSLCRTLLPTSMGDMLTGGWSEIVPIEFRMDESGERTEEYVKPVNPSLPLDDFEAPLYSFNGDEQPAWMKSSSGDLLPGFKHVATIRADLTSLKKSMLRGTGPRGPFWVVKFKVAIYFGATRLTACVIWDDEGAERRSPAVIIAE